MDLPNIVEGAVPASLSSAVAQGMLRDTLGFTGIIVTDSLAMGAITDRYSAAEAAVPTMIIGTPASMAALKGTKSTAANSSAVFSTGRRTALPPSMRPQRRA